MAASGVMLIKVQNPILHGVATVGVQENGFHSNNASGVSGGTISFPNLGPTPGKLYRRFDDPTYYTS